MDLSLIQPLPFPPKPDSLTNGFMVRVLAGLRPAIRVDNERKAELRRQLRACRLVTPSGQGRQTDNR